MSDRLANVSSALDIQTGGGEVLAGARTFPPRWRPPSRQIDRQIRPQAPIIVDVVIRGDLIAVVDGSAQASLPKHVRIEIQQYRSRFLY